MNEKKRALWPAQLRRPENYADRTTLPTPRTLTRANLAAVGFKAFHSTTKVPTTLNHLTNPALFQRTARYFAANHGVIIHLHRSNHLDRYISQVKSRHIGGGHCAYSKSCDPSTLASLKLQLDIPKMIDFISSAIHHDKTVHLMLQKLRSEFRIPVLDVDYDALSRSNTTTGEWQRVLTHLRLPPDDVRFLNLTLLTKDIQKSHAQIISNFPQVRSALSRHRPDNFSRFLSPP